MEDTLFAKVMVVREAFWKRQLSKDIKAVRAQASRNLKKRCFRQRELKVQKLRGKKDGWHV